MPCRRARCRFRALLLLMIAFKDAFDVDAMPGFRVYFRATRCQRCALPMIIAADAPLMIFCFSLPPMMLFIDAIITLLIIY